MTCDPGPLNFALRPFPPAVEVSIGPFLKKCNYFFVEIKKYFPFKSRGLGRYIPDYTKFYTYTFFAAYLYILPPIIYIYILFPSFINKGSVCIVYCRGRLFRWPPLPPPPYNQGDGRQPLPPQLVPGPEAE